MSSGYGGGGEGGGGGATNQDTLTRIGAIPDAGALVYDTDLALLFMGTGTTFGGKEVASAQYVTTVTRTGATYPAGTLVWDTDLGSLWIGDGITLGGVAAVLTADQMAAVTGASAPSAGNVFATMADVGGGGYPFYDWARLANTETEDQLNGTPDLSKWTTLQSLGGPALAGAALSMGNRALKLDFTVGANPTGLYIATPAGDFVYACRMMVQLDGASGVDALTSRVFQATFAYVESSNYLNGDQWGAGVNIGSSTWRNSYMANHDASPGGSGIDNLSFDSGFQWHSLMRFDVWLRRSGTDLEVYVAEPGRPGFLMHRQAAVNVTAEKVAVIGYSNTANANDRIFIEALGRFAALPWS